MTQFVRIADWVDREKRRLEERRSAEKKGQASKQPPAQEPSAKNPRIEELEKISKEKDDLFKRMSRYPDVFPLNNISYTRRKNMRKKVLQELNPRYFEHQDTPKEPDMNITFKNVREWIQRSMDVLEKNIMYDKNKKQAGKPGEQETVDFEKEKYPRITRLLIDAHNALIESLKGRSGIGNLKKRRGYLKNV